MDVMEAFLLAAIDTRYRSIYNYGTSAGYALSGLAVIELIRRERLALENGRLAVRDASLTGDELLDEALQAIAAKASPKKPDSWITALPYRVKGFVRRVMERLEDDGMIRIDSERFLGLIPYKRYTVTNESARNKIVDAAREVLLSGARTAEYELMLILSVAAACGFVEKIFSREEQKGMRETFKQLKKGTYFETDGDAVKLVVKAIQQAVSAAQSSAVMAAGV